MIPASLLKLKSYRFRISVWRAKWSGAMSVINALFSTAFLILVAASAAVTGSMVVLALFDRAFRKKNTPTPGRENALERESEDLEQNSRDEPDDELETIHAAQ